MKEILIISDTHGLLRDEVRSELSTSDFIIHAGDINTPLMFEFLNGQKNLLSLK